MLPDIKVEPDSDDVYVVKGWYFNNPDDYAEWKIEKDIAYIKNEDGKLVGKSSNFDPSIINEGLSIPLDNVAGIRSSLWVDGGATGMFIYHTDLEDNYGAGKRFDVKITGDGYTEYFAPPNNAEKLVGATMTGLRFDPDDYLYTDFGDWGLEYIEILAWKTPRVNYYVNNVLMNAIHVPVEKDGIMYMSAYRILETLDCDVNYVGKTQEFTIKKGDKEVILTGGSNIAKINGVDTVMPGAAYYENGHFMVPMNYICDLFGLKVTNEVVKADTGDGDKIPYQYEFNTDGDMEGWTKSGVAFAQVADGSMYLKSVSTDPLVQFNNININADEYHSKVTIRMKNLTGASNLILYFLTDTEPDYGPVGNPRRLEVPTTASEDWIEYTYDISENPSWKGTIKLLRVDPSSKMGDIYIDYIRVE